jgi:hypothetical protein
MLKILKDKKKYKILQDLFYSKLFSTKYQIIYKMAKLILYVYTLISPNSSPKVSWHAILCYFFDETLDPTMTLSIKCHNAGCCYAGCHFSGCHGTA